MVDFRQTMSRGIEAARCIKLQKTRFALRRSTNEKDREMKTRLINATARLTGMTITLALFASMAVALNAGEIQTGKGGATKLLQLSGRLVTPKSQPSDSQAMSCAKCKNEFVKRLDPTVRGANQPAILFARHLCAGCGTDRALVGQGKAKREITTHKCGSCGGELAACCATRQSDVTPT